MRRCGVDSTDSPGPWAGYRSELSGSIKGGEFLQWVIDY